MNCSSVKLLKVMSAMQKPDSGGGSGMAALSREVRGGLLEEVTLE